MGISFEVKEEYFDDDENQMFYDNDEQEYAFKEKYVEELTPRGVNIFLRMVVRSIMNISKSSDTSYSDSDHFFDYHHRGFPFWEVMFHDEDNEDEGGER